MIEVPMKSLLETGVHFGHQPRRWNPKMEPYIFTERKGVHIIDLEQTIEAVRRVTEVVTQRVAEGDTVLFVGTKRQASDSLEEHARRCGMPFVNRRWLGGTLTNFKTIRKSVDKLKELEKMEEENIMDRLSNREARRKQRERERLERNLSGIRDMDKIPQVLFVLDVLREEIAVREARHLDIPVVGVLDTNCDPEMVDYAIPGNDDAIRALGLYSQIIADAVIEGREIREKRKAEEIAALQAEELDEETLSREAEVIEPGELDEFDESVEIIAEVEDEDALIVEEEVDSEENDEVADEPPGSEDLEPVDEETSEIDEDKS